VFLAYLFTRLYKDHHKEIKNSDLEALYNLISEGFDGLYDKILKDGEKQYLDYISEFLISDKKAAIFYSTHYYNVLGGYISGIIGTAISHMTNSYFIPLYQDSNFNAILDLSQNLYPELKIGNKPLLQDVIDGKYSYVWAVGWNPKTYLPGSQKFPDSVNWIISSMIQDDFPDNTRVLLPEAHINEQMDLRTNFLSWQSIGSPAVKKPIGSAQTNAHFTYLLHQQASEQKLSLETKKEKISDKTWQENLRQEIAYYTGKIEDMLALEGQWLIPSEHIAHYKDAQLTRHSSWAKKDCVDENLKVSVEISRKHHLKSGQAVQLNINNQQMDFRVDVNSALSPNRSVGNAHYLPLRSGLPGEFADHNNEYYFWCPKYSLDS
jgi:hypothetical protein